MIFGFFVMKNLKLALKFRNFWKFLEKKTNQQKKKAEGIRETEIQFESIFKYGFSKKRYEYLHRPKVSKRTPFKFSIFK